MLKDFGKNFGEMKKFAYVPRVFLSGFLLSPTPLIPKKNTKKITLKHSSNINQY